MVGVGESVHWRGGRSGAGRVAPPAGGLNLSNESEDRGAVTISISYDPKGPILSKVLMLWLWYKSIFIFKYTPMAYRITIIIMPRMPSA